MGFVSNTHWGSYQNGYDAALLEVQWQLEHGTLEEYLAVALPKKEVSDD